ncbi:BrnT family toxin [Hydrogenimonas thermophila]|uniref:Uncharacterized protein n=1 Tax=Hydrogenimonas thermophila TaxID=223786 RepID=A0A1I5KWS5_9BACT|nr:BrnT family toxin [Hydrogenimonas thermophila]WOE69364.1 BrnT family toxin [Hydrogenimonas thermophila]WOE71874.1 BrnT family toxin [Hydrogenimonas thermophila]SFO89328.1 hypothetical protein SAMN05216234_101119 [Hydrogenimonas thermophila]
MEFEFDENKSKINKIKHGIDFIEAQKLWEQSDFIFFPAKEVNGEERYLLSAFLQDKCWSAIFTIRDGKIRIISVRRCRKNEKERIKL